jgi:hypothetical protein
MLYWYNTPINTVTSIPTEHTLWCDRISSTFTFHVSAKHHICVSVGYNTGVDLYSYIVPIYCIYIDIVYMYNTSVHIIDVNMKHHFHISVNRVLRVSQHV